ncbi:MAG: Sapep family Mn(2+)-dependent dipeptidase [Eubacteriales bacterium]|nr:Sapep family Mn(2+)-dependent dipeptidase [Eubacteriales bacterium]
MDLYTKLDLDKDAMIRETQRLIRMKSVQEEPAGDMPFGKAVDEALDYVLDIARKMGFTVKKINGYCGYAEYGEGETYIGVMGHVDVNKEDADNWKHDPYGGTVVNGKIYGAAAVDKGALIAALYALRAVKENAGRLKRKVRLIVGTDERRLYRDMASYLKHENPPIAGFTIDGHFPVTYAEKSLAMFAFDMQVPQEGEEYIRTLHGGKLDNLVPGYCRAVVVTKRKNEIVQALEEYAEVNRRDINVKMLEDGLLIEAFGRERHCAALEKGINSIAIMLDFLSYIDLGTGPCRKACDFLNEKIGMDIYGENLGIAYEDDFSGKTTVNLGTMDIEDGWLEVALDCRYPTSCNYIGAIETINQLFEEAGFRKVSCNYWPPTYFPRNHFLIHALLESYREVTGDESEPVSGSSASYAKAMPNVAAFGAHFPGEGIIWDQTDEYIEIDSLVKTAKIYARSIYQLCTAL